MDGLSASTAAEGKAGADRQVERQLHRPGAERLDIDIVL